MENLSHALYILFAVFTFILAFTYSLSMVSSLNNTAETLMYGLDKTNYYDTLTLDYLISENNCDNSKQLSKTVGIDSIIPTLYRYYKESFAVKILDEEGNLMQIFDANTEGAVMTANATIASKRTDQQKALLSLYGAKKNGTSIDNPCNLFGATWLGSTNKDTKERIDLYISGGAGYINNTYVDYGKDYSSAGLKISSSSGTQAGKIYLNNFKDRKFKEVFTQYAYEGDTLTTENDELLSLTGTQQIATKIIIIYQLLPE